MSETTSYTNMVEFLFSGLCRTRQENASMGLW